MLKVNAGEYFLFISYTVSMFKSVFLDLIEWVNGDTLKLCGVHLV